MRVIAEQYVLYKRDSLKGVLQGVKNFYLALRKTDFLTARQLRDSRNFRKRFTRTCARERSFLEARALIRQATRARRETSRRYAVPSGEESRGGTGEEGRGGVLRETET